MRNYIYILAITLNLIAYKSTAQVVCSSFTELKAAENTKGSWSVSSGKGKFSVPSSSNTTVTGMAFGKNTYCWTYFKNGKTLKEYHTIISEEISIEIHNTCNEHVQLIAKSKGNKKPVGEWSVKSESATIEAPEQSSTIAHIEEGVHTFTWESYYSNCIVMTAYTFSNPIIKAGTELEFCSDTTTLKIKSSNHKGGKWELIEGRGIIHTPSKQETLVTGLYMGANTFRWTAGTDECPSNYPEVTVRNNNQVVYAGRNRTITTPDCRLSAGDIYIGSLGKWSVLKGNGDFEDIFSSKTTVENLNGGENIFEWTVINEHGCTSKDQVIITYDRLEANAGEDQDLCTNATKLDATGADKGYWSVKKGSGVLSDPTDPKSEVSQLGEGENIFIWTIEENNYSESDTVSIYNWAMHDASFQYKTCDESPTVRIDPKHLQKNTLTWLTVEGQSIQKADDFKWTFENLSEGKNIFNAVISNEQTGCSAALEAEITRITTPKANFTASSANGCSPLTVAFTNTSETPDNVMYLWQIGDLTFSQQQDAEYTFVQKGDELKKHKISLWAIDQESMCSDSVSKEIVVYPEPDINFTSDRFKVDADHKEVQFLNFTWGGGSYEWTFGDGKQSEEEKPLNTYEQSGLFDVSLSAKNTYSCASVLTIENYIEADIVIETDTTSLSSNDFKLSKMRIYPTITKDIVNVVTDSEFNSNLEILLLSAEGQLLEIKSFNRQVNRTHFSLEELSSGVYYIRIKNGRSKKTIRVLKL